MADQKKQKQGQQDPTKDKAGNVRQDQEDQREPQGQREPMKGEDLGDIEKGVAADEDIDEDEDEDDDKVTQRNPAQSRNDNT